MSENESRRRMRNAGVQRRKTVLATEFTTLDGEIFGGDQQLHLVSIKANCGRKAYQFFTSVNAGAALR